jgi:putative ABC transport system permease protein
VFIRPGAPPTHAVPPMPSQQAMSGAVHEIASALGTKKVLELESPDANLNHTGPGRQFSGQVYVATPALLHAFGINASQIQPDADVLTMRPGLSGVSDLQLVWGNGPGGAGGPSGTGAPGGGGGASSNPCPPSSCLAHPVIQELGALPAGTSAPNTVITEHAVRRLHLQTTLAGWFLQSHGPISAAQLQSARQAAASAGLAMESKNDAPTSSEVIDWATLFGIALALGVLAMSIGLIRSETAGDLRTLTATGASSFTRRSLTAVTAGGLALLGALMGTLGAYVAAAGWFNRNALNGGLSALRDAPWSNLFLIVVGMPLLATVVGWLLAGREPSTIALRPSE